MYQWEIIHKDISVTTTIPNDAKSPGLLKHFIEQQTHVQ